MSCWQSAFSENPDPAKREKDPYRNEEVCEHESHTAANFVIHYGTKMLLLVARNSSPTVGIPRRWLRDFRKQFFRFFHRLHAVATFFDLLQYRVDAIDDHRKLFTIRLWLSRQIEKAAEGHPP